MTWHMIYDSTTGKAVSIGTVVADPLPEHLADQIIPDDISADVLSGKLLWNEESLDFQPNPNYVEPVDLMPEGWTDEFSEP
jgi:hypothetical protein